VEGVTVPMRDVPPPPFPEPVKNKSDEGVIVTQNAGFMPQSWPGKPIIATVDNPYYKATYCASFNANRNCEFMGQTFQVHEDFTLDRISIFGGDGLGYDDENTIVIGLYDLGSVSEQADNKSYTVKENLFNSLKGLKIAYEVQPLGLIHFDLKKSNQLKLKAGHRYAFELKGKKGYLSMGWRRTRSDIFNEGAAYNNRSIIRERGDDTVDYAMALYGTDSPKK